MILPDQVSLSTLITDFLDGFPSKDVAIAAIVAF